MNSRIALALLTPWLLALPAAGESNFGTLAFSADEIVGSISFTALAPGETTSGFAPFAGYSQAASPDYTYLYLVENDSAAGTPTSFCNEHCLYGVELITLLDPSNAAQIHTIGHDASNGGELPSFVDSTTTPNDISYEFDSPPNYGILPEGGLSAILRFFSPFGPSSGGGVIITNNTAPFDNFAELTSGVTTPVPEPGTAALVLAGLLGIGIRRRLN